MSNAFYQGISWLTKKAFVYALIGLGIGLIAGFKLANSQYRKQQNATTAAEALQAASRVQGGRGAVSVTGGNAPQGEQIINQTRAIIEKARQNPNDFEAQMVAAEQFMQIRRPEGALEFLQQANKLKPDDGEVMSELAGAYFFQQQFSDAITWARRALGKTPDNPPAKFYLAYSLIMSRQNLKEAEQLLSQLEASSANAPESAREALAEMRERLQQAKQGGTSGKAETTLSHGPEEKSAAGGQKVMLRLVIGIFIFAFIVYVLKIIARLSFNVRKTVREVRTLRNDLNTARGPSKAKQVSAEMVRCAACGAFVSARDAMMVSSRGRSAAFCSEECLRAHVKSA